MLYLSEWVPENYPEVDWSTLTQERWEELEEQIEHDIDCARSAESERYPSFVLESESNAKLQSQATDYESKIFELERDLKHAEQEIRNLIYDNRCLTQELHSQGW